MDNTKYTLNLLKNSVQTLKFDRLLERAAKNPALGMTIADFLDYFNESYFKEFFKYAGKEVWENPQLFNLSLINLSSSEFRILQNSVSDLDGNPSPQEVFVALAFRYIRSKIGKERLSIYLQKDAPIVYNFTFNSTDIAQKERAGVGQKNLFYKGSISPYFGYRVASDEVIRMNATDKIYSKSEYYGDESAEIMSFRPTGINDKSLYDSFYGQPSVDEIKKIVDISKANIGKVLTAKTEFIFIIEKEKQKEILSSCNRLSNIVIVNEAKGNFISDEEEFKSVVENQICITISEGTSDEPVKSVNIPFSGFYAMLQIAANLGRETFRVKKVDGMAIIDFSFTEDVTSTEWIIDENGEPKDKTITQKKVIPAYYEFNTESCTTTISAVFFSKEPDFVIEPEKVAEVQLQEKPLIMLPLNLLRKSVFKNKRPIVVDSLIEWSRVDSNFYENAISIAESYVNNYTQVKKNKETSVLVRSFDQSIFESKKLLLESLGQVEYSQRIDSYVWSVEEKFWDLNPNFDIEKTLHYFLGMGLGRVDEDKQKNGYRLLCARILGIDYFLHYEELVKSALTAENSTLYIDFKYLKLNNEIIQSGNAENFKIFADSIRAESEFVRQNLYELEEFLSSNDFKEYCTAVGLSADVQVERHLACINKYKSQTAKFHFEKKFIDYDILVKNKGLSKAYLPEKTESNYDVDNTDTMSKITNADYERRRIVLPQIFIKSGSLSTQSEYFPEDFVWGKNAEFSQLSPIDLHNIFYRQQSKPNDAKIFMYQAGVPLSNADAGASENVKTEFVQMSLLEYFGYTSQGKPAKEVDMKVWAENPNTLQFLPPSGKLNLGLLPTKRTLWKFAEPFFWKNYPTMLQGLKDVGLLNQSDQYISEEVGKIILDRMDSEYQKIASKAQIVGDEIHTFSGVNQNSFDDAENVFNRTFNNAPNKAKYSYNDTPIFLEYSRLFSKNKALFNLRPAQLNGLRFLGGSGNSGILAHEVGFGKTTSSISKISDLFLRNEASIVLVIAPTEEVYNKWFDEIRGTEGAIGVLGLNANLIGLGNLEYEALKGKSTGDDFQKKAKFGDYDGAFEFTEAQMNFISKASEIGSEIVKKLGGRGQRLINWSKESALKEASILLSETGISREEVKSPPKPVKWYGNAKLDWNETKLVAFNERKGVNYDLVNEIVDERNVEKVLRLGSIKDLSGKKSGFTLFEIIFESAKKFVPEISAEELSGLWTYLQEIEIKYKSIETERANQEVDFRSKSPIAEWSGRLKNVAIIPAKYQRIKSFKPYGTENISGKLTGGSYWEIRENLAASARKILAGYAFGLASYVISDGSIKMPSTPTNAGAFQLLPHIRKTILAMSKSDIENRFFNGNKASVILQQDENFVNVVFSNFLNLVEKLEIGDWTYDFTVNGRNIYSDLSIGNIEAALEFEMTSEIVEVFNNLKSIALCIGRLKNIAKQPQTIFVALKTAVGKFKMPYNYSTQAAMIMNDFPDSEEVIVKGYQRVVFGQSPNTSFFSNKSYSAIASNQLNAISITRFAFDAVIFDEVHNFNRGFKKATSLAVGSMDSSKTGNINTPLRTTLNRQDLLYVQTFSAEAKYNIRSDVQNFGALCLMIADVSNRKYSTPNRKVNNNIFLSATPFTDDNFQAYTLFKFMNSDLMNQLGITSIAKFYRLFAKEIYKIDINIRGDVGLFPVIDGYKNTYILSRLIGTFSDFAVSDVEIDKRRPKKIVVANNVSYPSNAGVDDKNFAKITEEIKNAKINSFIPKNDVQKRMAQDASDYIVGKIDIPLRSSKSQIVAGNSIYDDIIDWKKKSRYSDKSKDEVMKIVKSLSALFEKKAYTVEGEQKEKFVLKNDTDGEKVEELLDKGFELDPTNLDLRKYAISFEASEDDVIDLDDLELDDTSSVGGASGAQQIASRTMQMALISALTLLSPYFVTTDKQGARFKKGDNPYLPPLNYKDNKGNYVFESYENAKTFVENSPKIYYTCESIAQQIKFQKDRGDKVSGSIVYSQYYQFTYHGHSWKLFDLMSIYLLGKYPQLFEEDYQGNSTKDLTFEEKLKLFFVQIVGSEKAKDQVDKFNSGEAYVLFGTERIKEGVDLQKNSTFLYILTIGYVPVTFMQLHGRMWRQGNPFKYCFIVNVLVKNSIDAFQYSKLDQKINAVRNMLESGVYDANETQFDVDVNEIKLNLINDAEKLAELEYETIKDELATKVKTMQTQVEVLAKVQDNLTLILPDYKAKASKVSLIWNEFSKVYLLILASARQESANKDAYNAAKNSIAEVRFLAQFTDKDVNTPEGEAEYDNQYTQWLKLKDEQSKLTSSQWTEEQKKKKWKDYLKIETSSKIKSSLSNSDPAVQAEAQSFGLMTFDEAKEKVLSDTRYKNLKSKVEADISGYIPYAIYDELQENIYAQTDKFLMQEADINFIEDYNSWMSLAINYKSGKVKEKDLLQNYVANRSAVFNALYITYIVMPLLDEISGSYNLAEIDTTAYLARYTRPVRGEQFTIMGTPLYQKVDDNDAIPARSASLKVQSFIDSPINDPKTSEVLQGYERLLKGKGEKGADLEVSEIPTLVTNFKQKIEKGNEKLIRPAETKAELAKGFQDKLDAIASQKDEDINEKIKELGVLYPLIQRKQD